MKNFLFLLVLFVVAIFLSGCTNESVCGDGVCDFLEQDSQSPYYCAVDCGGADDDVKFIWSTAQPWGITDWVMVGNELSLVLVNNSSEAMLFNKISVNGFENYSYNVECVESDDPSLSCDVSSVAPPIMPGQEIKRKIIFDEACVPDSKYVFSKEDIFIEYKLASESNLIMSGVADIIGVCQGEELKELNLITNMIISKTAYTINEEVQIK